MPGSPLATTVVKTAPSFLEMFVDLLLERADEGRQRSSSTQLVGLQSLVRFRKKSPPTGVPVSRKGFEAGLSKQQVSNVFANQEALHAANVSPLTAINTFSGVRSGKIKADFYDDCQDIPDPSTLDPVQKNLMLLDNPIPIRCKESNTYPCRPLC